MSQTQIEDNFILLENGLFKCKGCGALFRNEKECNRHLEELEEGCV